MKTCTFCHWRPFGLICALFFFVYGHLQCQESQEELRLNDRATQVRAHLKAGNYQQIDEAREKKDLALLWHLFRTASRAKEQRADLWDPVEEKVRRALLSHPDHAKFLGDQLEAFSSDYTKNHLRERYFALLGSFGGTEAIAQLGRFILDDRNPLPPWVIPGKTIGSLPSRNSAWAAQAMDKALGEASPWWPYRINDQPASSYAGGPPIFDIMKQWWVEKGAEKYGLGIQPAIHPVPKPKAEAPPVLDHGPASAESWAWELPAVLTLILLSVLLVVLRKRRSF